MDSCAATLLFAIQGIDIFTLACSILYKFNLRSPMSISASSYFDNWSLSLAGRNASSPPRDEVTDGLRAVHSDS